MIDGLMSHPYVSLGAIVVGIAAVCAIIAILRGVFRLILNTILLALSLWVGYWVWMHTAGWGGMVFPHTPRWATYILPALAGGSTLVLLRKIIRFLFSPSPPEEETSGCSGGKMFSAVLSLFPTAVLCLIAALLIRHLGTLRLVEDPNTRAISVMWKDVIDGVIPPAWLERIDPVTDPLRLTLAQWISQASEPTIPRAIPVSDPDALDEKWTDDPKWKKLLEQGRYGDILRDPEIVKALQDPRVKKVLEEIRREMSQ